MKNIQITKKNKNIIAISLILILISLLALFINNINQPLTIKKKAATIFKAKCSWDPIQAGLNYKVTITENCGNGDNNINISQPPAGGGSVEFNATAGCSYRCTVRAEDPVDPSRCYREKTANAAIAEIPLNQPTNTPIMPPPCNKYSGPPGYIWDDTGGPAPAEGHCKPKGNPCNPCVCWECRNNQGLQLLRCIDFDYANNICKAWGPCGVNDQELPPGTCHPGSTGTPPPIIPTGPTKPTLTPKVTPSVTPKTTPLLSITTTPPVLTTTPSLTQTPIPTVCPLPNKPIVNVVCPNCNRQNQ